MPELSDPDWAYAAAFVDGEGCIAIVRSFAPARGRYYYGVNVVVANRDRKVLDWMQINWGGWVVPVSSRRGLAQESWTWRCSSLAARPVLIGIRPWLRIKSKQCDNALEMIGLLQRSRGTLGRAPLPKSWLAEQEELYWGQRRLNHRGATPFVKRAMHSPRLIKRAQYAANLGPQ